MMIRTDRYGVTVLKGEVTQAPSLQTRVRSVLEGYGVRSPRIESRACALVKAHPSLRAEDAVDYVIHRLGR